MIYHFIAVRPVADNRNRVDIYDMTQLLRQRPLLQYHCDFATVAGKDHTVYIIDCDGAYNRRQLVQIASKLVANDYDIYSLLTGQWTAAGHDGG